MKVLFIASGPIEFGSSRMRCYWPAQHMDATVVHADEWKRIRNVAIDEYDALVFQKNGDAEAQERARTQGKQVWFDACDPSWWFSPDATARILSNCDGVVCSNEALADDLRSWFRGNHMNLDGRLRVEVIPDCLDLSHFPKQRQHADVTPVRLIWYGMAQNRIGLYAAAANLDRLVANGVEIELTIMDNRPDSRFVLSDAYPTYNVEWSLESENEIIAAHDVALLGVYPGPWGKVKSPNRAYTAMACGLPAVTGTDYMALASIVADAGQRTALAQDGLHLVRESYTAERAASRWMELLCAS